MTWGRGSLLRPLGLALGVVLVLAGCGSGAEEVADEPGLVIPGSTKTIGTDAPPTTDPTEPATEPTTGTTFPPVADLEQLVQVLGDSMTTTTTVRITTAADGAVAQEADYRYLQGATVLLGDCDVRLLAGDAGVAEYRVFGQEVFVRATPDGPWQRYDAGTADAALDQLVTAASQFVLLAALNVELTGAEDFAPAPDGPTDVDGTPVATYDYTVDASSLSLSGRPDLPAGPVDVRLSIDESGRPVRFERTFSDGTVLTDDYAGWGEPVEIDDPLAG